MKPNRHWALLAGGLILAAALTYSLYTNPEWKNFNFDRFVATFGEADWSWLAVALAAVFLTYLVRAVRWKVFLQPVKPDASLAGLLSATVIGFGAVGVLGRPAEIVRPYLIARAEQTPVSSQLAIWVLERSFDALILLAGVAFALGQMQSSPASSAPSLPQWWYPLSQVAGATLVALLVVLIVLREYYDHLSGRLAGWLRTRLHPRSGGHWDTRLDGFSNKLALFGEGLHSLRKVRSIVLCLLLSIINWALIVLCFYCVLAALVPRSGFGFSAAIVFTGIVMVGSLFQIPGIGGGVQVSAVLVLTELLAVPVEAASSAAILIWFLTFIAVVLPALALMARQGLHWVNLCELESRPERPMAL